MNCFFGSVVWISVNYILHPYNCNVCALRIYGRVPFQMCDHNIILYDVVCSCFFFFRFYVCIAVRLGIIFGYKAARFFIRCLSQNLYRM